MIITHNGYVIYYNYGEFDQYCVHVLKPKKKSAWRPLDKEYFNWLKNMGKRYGNDYVYEDFLKVYEIISKTTTMYEIENIVKEVKKNYFQGELWWTIFALTMKAEECKEYTKLGKRIKHLGVYNILKENMKVSEVVSYMKGKKWYELDEMMRERGI